MAASPPSTPGNSLRPFNSSCSKALRSSRPLSSLSAIRMIATAANATAAVVTAKRALGRSKLRAGAIRLQTLQHQCQLRRFASVHDGLAFVRSVKMASVNVFKKPLKLHSTSPVTGFMRDGYCNVPAEDSGNHSVAAVVTDEFLDFSASKGNNLRAAGLTDGCKWCLCVTRWKEAFLAGNGTDDKVVPKVFLNATNETALKSVKLEDLKRFAIDKEE